MRRLVDQSLAGARAWDVIDEMKQRSGRNPTDTLAVAAPDGRGFVRVDPRQVHGAGGVRVDAAHRRRDGARRREARSTCCCSPASGEVSSPSWGGIRTDRGPACARLSSGETPWRFAPSRATEGSPHGPAVSFRGSSDALLRLCYRAPEPRGSVNEPGASARSETCRSPPHVHPPDGPGARTADCGVREHDRAHDPALRGREDPGERILQGASIWPSISARGAGSRSESLRLARLRRGRRRPAQA